jgi:hypothetical protein
MEEAIFEKCLADLAQIGYAEAISLFANNEPLLDPRLFDFLRRTAEVLPRAKSFLFTNGDLLDADVIRRLFANGLRKLCISRYEEDRREEMEHFVDYFGRERVTLQVTSEAEVSAAFHNFGGNVKHPGVNQHPVTQHGCRLPFTKTVVNTDGFLCLCCLDCYSDVAFENVMDKPLPKIFTENRKLNEIRATLKTSRTGLHLCETCSYGGGDYSVFG